MIRALIAVFVGGGAGSMLRYGVQLLLHERIVPYSFPWSTLAVNIIGSGLIGLFYALSAKFNLSAEVRLLLTAGLCGGFTTFSTFSYDIVEMGRHGQVLPIILYATMSIVLGILATLGGASLSKIF